MNYFFDSTNLCSSSSSSSSSLLQEWNSGDLKKLNLNLEHPNNADFREGDRTRVDVRIRIHSRMTYKF